MGGALGLRLEDHRRSGSGWHTAAGRGTDTAAETAAGSSACLIPRERTSITSLAQQQQRLTGLN